MVINLGWRRAPQAPAPAAAAGRPASGGGRLVALDGLRLFAALFVAFFHYTGREPNVERAWGVGSATAFPGLREVSAFGWMGVELFFLISGFVICMSCWGRSTGDFFRSRMVRLFPAYWAGILITSAVLIIWPIVVQPRSPSDILLNLTMLQRPLHVDQVEGVYWSLWAEARFYLLFSLLVWRGLTLRRTVIFGYAWLIASVLATRADEHLVGVVLMPEYAPLFVAGIAFYLIHRFGSDILLWGLVAFSYLLAQHNLMLRVIGVSEDDVQRPLSSKVAIGLLTLFFAVMAAVALGWTSWVRGRWLTTAGLLTYPFYLLHENIGWTIIHALRDVRPRYLTLAFVLAVMLLASWLLHRLIERPLAAVLRGRLKAAFAAFDRPDRRYGGGSGPPATGRPAVRDAAGAADDAPAVLDTTLPGPRIRPESRAKADIAD
ncbi:acyltransferase family protein [Krasilnikovia sp. MM14-A1004]|uniref:acyltransferase family protein n=1 Tax=Krasilnikovia sp. MM14-A1004 TaxID=3373541 RepID=UPI00399D5016